MVKYYQRNLEFAASVKGPSELFIGSNLSADYISYSLVPSLCSSCCCRDFTGFLSAGTLTADTVVTVVNLWENSD